MSGGRIGELCILLRRKNSIGFWSVQKSIAWRRAVLFLWGGQGIWLPWVCASASFAFYIRGALLHKIKGAVHTV